MTAIGLQLYTLRRECTRDILGALEEVAAVGYGAVEWFGGRFGAPLEAIQERLQSLGLVVLGTHVSLEDLETRAQEVVEHALALGCHHLVCPWLSESRRSGVGAYELVGRFLDGLGAELAGRGLRLSYHNHDFELRVAPPPDGLERLARASRPEHLGFELDVYWLAYAGADPVVTIERYADRVHLIHLKDGRLDRTEFTPLGGGEVELGPVVRLGRSLEVDGFVVEQDECEGSPIDAAAQSLETLRRLIDETSR